MSNLEATTALLAQAEESGGFMGTYFLLILPIIILSAVVCLHPIGKRELQAYFLTPIAYVSITMFVLLTMVITFFIMNFFERGEANLEAFFRFQPFVWGIVGPALGMRLWAEENRLGTIELIGTMPSATWVVTVYKYLASLIVVAVALVLTFPIVATVEDLGSPDHGVIAAGYIASFLMGAATLAITMAVSAFTRNQVICLLVSVVICFFLVIGGLPQVVGWLDDSSGFVASMLKWWPNASLFYHYESMITGLIFLRNILYFVIIVAACLAVTSAALRSKRA